MDGNNPFDSLAAGRLPPQSRKPPVPVALVPPAPETHQPAESDFMEYSLAPKLYSLYGYRPDPKLIQQALGCTNDESER